MATDLRTTALTALASIPADPANLLLYVVDLTEALPGDQSKKMTLAALDARYPGAVSSVFGRAGAVVAVAGDYTASFITNVPAGGIAATTVQAAITELDTEKQPLDATLTAFAAQVGAADKLTYFTALDTFALADFTPFARTILDDASQGAVQTTLGLVPGTNVQAYDAFLTSIATLGTAADKMIYTTDVDVAAETALTPFARSILDDANEATFKATVNLEIGVDVQAWDADLDTIAGLAKTDGNFIVGDGAAWVVESGATARTSLGLGTIATQNANSVTISGGSITGITDLAIADGGTGQSTAQLAINALSNVAAATNEHVLTKDTASGNAIFKAAAGGSSLPVADTQTLVMGSADNTKLLRFEVDGFTAGATRVMTPPNQDTTLAGQNFANVFTVAQTINVNSALALFVEQDGVHNDTLIVDTTNGRVGAGIVPTAAALETKTDSTTKSSLIVRAVAGILSNVMELYDKDGNLGFYFDRFNIFYIENSVQIKAIRTSTISSIEASSGIGAGGELYNVAIRPRSSNGYLPLVIENDLASGGTFVSNNILIQNNASFGGTPAAGFGSAIRFQLESTTTDDRDAARIVALWDVATDASRSAALKILISGTSEVDAAKFDDDATAGNTRFLVYDVDNGQLERVSVGIADSGGVGFKLLRIAN